MSQAVKSAFASSTKPFVIVEGNWKQFTGKAREKWGKLTDDDWTIVAGKKDQLIGKIQERYGVKRDEAQKQADEWARALKEDKEMHS